MEEWKRVSIFVVGKQKYSGIAFSKGKKKWKDYEQTCWYKVKKPNI